MAEIIKTLKIQLNQLEAILNEKDEEKQKDKRLIAELINKNLKMSQELRQTKEKLAEANKKNSNLKMDLKKSSGNLYKSQNYVEELEDQVFVATNEVREKLKWIENLKTEKGSYMMKFKKVKEELAENLDQKKKLNEVLRVKNKNIKNLENQLETKDFFDDAKPNSINLGLFKVKQRLKRMRIDLKMPSIPEEIER